MSYGTKKRFQSFQSIFEGIKNTAGQVRRGRGMFRKPNSVELCVQHTNEVLQQRIKTSSTRLVYEGLQLLLLVFCFFTTQSTNMKFENISSTLMGSSIKSEWQKQKSTLKQLSRQSQLSRIKTDIVERFTAIMTCIKRSLSTPSCPKYTILLI